MRIAKESRGVVFTASVLNSDGSRQDLTGNTKVELVFRSKDGEVRTVEAALATPGEPATSDITWVSPTDYDFFTKIGFYEYHAVITYSTGHVHASYDRVPFWVT